MTAKLLTCPNVDPLENQRFQWAQTGHAQAHGALKPRHANATHATSNKQCNSRHADGMLKSRHAAKNACDKQRATSNTTAYMLMTCIHNER